MLTHPKAQLLAIRRSHPPPFPQPIPPSMAPVEREAPLFIQPSTSRAVCASGVFKRPWPPGLRRVIASNGTAIVIPSPTRPPTNLITDLEQAKAVEDWERSQEEKFQQHCNDAIEIYGNLTPAQLLEGEREADDIIDDILIKRRFRLTYIHVTLPSMVAAAEIRDDSSLKFKPVAVFSRQSVISVNDLATDQGVQPGMTIELGKRLCPTLKVVHANFDKYNQITMEMKKILREYDPKANVAMDSGDLDMSNFLAKNHYHPDILTKETDRREPVVDEIRRKVFEKIGIKPRIGVGPSQLIAKLGCLIRLPSGVHVVGKKKDEISKFIRGLPITHYCGVSRRMEAMLRAINLTNTDEVWSRRGALSRVFSVNKAKQLLCICMGVTDESMGYGIITRTDDGKNVVAYSKWLYATTQRQYLNEVIKDISFKLDENMKKVRVVAQGLEVRVTTIESDYREKISSLQGSTNDANQILKTALESLDLIYIDDPALLVEGIRITATQLIFISSKSKPSPTSNPEASRQNEEQVTSGTGTGTISNSVKRRFAPRKSTSTAPRTASRAVQRTRRLLRPATTANGTKKSSRKITRTRRYQRPKASSTSTTSTEKSSASERTRRLRHPATLTKVTETATRSITRTRRFLRLGTATSTTSTEALSESMESSKSSLCPQPSTSVAANKTVFGSLQIDRSFPFPGALRRRQRMPPTPPALTDTPVARTQTLLWPGAASSIRMTEAASGTVERRWTSTSSTSATSTETVTNSLKRDRGLLCPGALRRRQESPERQFVPPMPPKRLNMQASGTVGRASDCVGPPTSTSATSTETVTNSSERDRSFPFPGALRRLQELPERQFMPPTPPIRPNILTSGSEEERPQSFLPASTFSMATEAATRSEERLISSVPRTSTCTITTGGRFESLERVQRFISPEPSNSTTTTGATLGSFENAKRFICPGTLRQCADSSEGQYILPSPPQRPNIPILPTSVASKNQQMVSTPTSFQVRPTQFSQVSSIPISNQQPSEALQIRAIPLVTTSLSNAAPQTHDISLVTSTRQNEDSQVRPISMETSRHQNENPHVRIISMETSRRQNENPQMRPISMETSRRQNENPQMRPILMETSRHTREVSIVPPRHGGEVPAATTRPTREVPIVSPIRHGGEVPAATTIRPTIELPIVTPIRHGGEVPAATTRHPDNEVPRWQSFTISSPRRPEESPQWRSLTTSTSGSFSEAPQMQTFLINTTNRPDEAPQLRSPSIENSRRTYETPHLRSLPMENQRRTYETPQQQSLPMENQRRTYETPQQQPLPIENQRRTYETPQLRSLPIENQRRMYETPQPRSRPLENPRVLFETPRITSVQAATSIHPNEALRYLPQITRRFPEEAHQWRSQASTGTSVQALQRPSFTTATQRRFNEPPQTHAISLVTRRRPNEPSQTGPFPVSAPSRPMMGNEGRKYDAPAPPR